MPKLITAVLVSFGLLASACGGGSSSSDTAADSANVEADSAAADTEAVEDTTGDGVDTCGQGQAFPDDPDFREAICRPLLAMVDLIGTDAEIDPEWNTRITTAILDYANRDAAMAELGAVLAEIQAAG